MDLGYVGLGTMGWPMVQNLMKAGHRMIVFNRSEPGRERARQAGAVVMDSPRAVAEAADIVMTCIATPAAVEQVYTGKDGLREGARPGQLFIDLSSNTPGLMRTLAASLGEMGASLIDAPVSGGTIGASAGTLAIMVGGSDEDFRRAEPLLHIVGEKIFHIGPVGAGSTVKILNQLLVGINTLATVEMVNLARRSGIDPKLIEEIITASSGFSKSFQTRYPKAMAHDFSLGFAIDLMAKDLRLGRDMAKEMNARLSLASLALDMFDEAIEKGMGGEDTSGAVRLYEE